MDGINTSDGRVIHVCGDVLSEMRAVTRQQKVGHSFKTSRDLWQNHKMIAIDLEDRFNIDCEQKRHEKFTTELANIKFNMSVIDGIKKAKEEVEKRKRIGKKSKASKRSKRC